MTIRLLFFLALVGLISLPTKAQTVENFKLQDAISDQWFELESHQESKGIVLVFTSLNCPFSKLYEERLIALHQKFSTEGFVFALVNPHVGVDLEENKEEMKNRAKEKFYPFPFLMDDEQIITQRLGVSKLPEVVVISANPTGMMVSYRGSIDNNPQVASGVSIKYLENALTSLSQKRNPSPSSSRPVGCNIKRIP